MPSRRGWEGDAPRAAPASMDLRKAGGRSAIRRIHRLVCRLGVDRRRRCASTWSRPAGSSRTRSSRRASSGWPRRRPTSSPHGPRPFIEERRHHPEGGASTSLRKYRRGAGDGAALQLTTAMYTGDENTFYATAADAQDRLLLQPRTQPRRTGGPGWPTHGPDPGRARRRPHLGQCHATGGNLDTFSRTRSRRPRRVARRLHPRTGSSCATAGARPGATRASAMPSEAYINGGLLRRELRGDPTTMTITMTERAITAAGSRACVGDLIDFRRRRTPPPVIAGRWTISTRTCSRWATPAPTTRTTGSGRAARSVSTSRLSPRATAGWHSSVGGPGRRGRRAEALRGRGPFDFTAVAEFTAASGQIGCAATG